MGVDYYVCDNCKQAMSEYDYIHCGECETILCSCIMADDLKKQYGYWDNVDYDSELARKYTYYNDDYENVLKKEFCPICQKNEKFKNDKEILTKVLQLILKYVIIKK